MPRQAGSDVEWNTREWTAALKAAAKEATIRSEDDLARVGITIQNEARRLAPVDTGRLRSSIQASEVRRDARGPYVEVGTNVEYAPFVEFGTSRQRPRPFLRPAFLYAVQAMRRKP